MTRSAAIWLFLGLVACVLAAPQNLTSDHLLQSMSLEELNDQLQVRLSLPELHRESG
jgi:hypothetical protein